MTGSKAGTSVRTLVIYFGVILIRRAAKGDGTGGKVHIDC